MYHACYANGFRFDSYFANFRSFFFTFFQAFFTFFFFTYLLLRAALSLGLW